jgi:retron-type reverse transcriptase
VDRRPLTLASPVDKIVFRSIANALEEIYETLFFPVSFGFRPYLSTQALFLEVQRWKGVKRALSMPMYEGVSLINRLGSTPRTRVKGVIK